MIAWIVAFVATFVLDIFWTLYIAETSERKAVPAAAWSAMIMCASGIATTLYVKDPWLIIPAAMGAFVGTWATIKWKNRNA